MRGRQRISTIPAVDAMLAPHRDELNRLRIEERKSFQEVLEILTGQYGLQITYAQLYEWYERERDRIFNDISGDSSIKVEELIQLLKVCTEKLMMNGGDPETLRHAINAVAVLDNNASRKREIALKLAAMKQRKLEYAARHREEARRHRLNELKFKTDVAEKALQYAAELKGIQYDNSLSMNQKVEAVRSKIFGTAA